MPLAAIPFPPSFNPSPAAADALIAAISDPTLSLQALAAQHNTTVEALSLWMIRPEIRERLEQVDRIAAWRTRLTANAALFPVVATLSTILQDFVARKATTATPATPPLRGGSGDSDATPITPPPDRTLLDLRTEEHIRKSAAILLRLANLRPVAAHDKLAPATPRAAAQSTDTSDPRAHPTHAAALELLHSAARTRDDKPESPPDTPSRTEHSASPPPPHTPAAHPTPAPTIISPFADPLADPAPRKPILTTLRKPPTSPTHLLAAAAREHWP